MTDAILFDRKLFNPLFNYLSTLALFLPLAARRNIPTVLYNVSLGPATTVPGKWCLRRVLNHTRLVILRDQESYELTKLLGIPHDNVYMGADCALNTKPCEPLQLNEIITAEECFTNPRGTIGFNINSYIDVYVRGKREGIGRKQFLAIIAAAIDRVIEELGVDVLFVVTQYMDLEIAREAINEVRQQDRVKLVSNRSYSHGELAALLSKVELLVGMRTHSLILAASVGVPVVGIVSYPKTLGFLRSIDQEQYALEFNSFTTESLFALIARAWNEHTEIRANLAKALEREKPKARHSATLLSPFLRSRWI